MINTSKKYVVIKGIVEILKWTAFCMFIALIFTLGAILICGYPLLEVAPRFIGWMIIICGLAIVETVLDEISQSDLETKIL